MSPDIIPQIYDAVVGHGASLSDRLVPFSLGLLTTLAVLMLLWKLMFHVLKLDDGPNHLAAQVIEQGLIAGLLAWIISSLAGDAGLGAKAVAGFDWIAGTVSGSPPGGPVCWAPLAPCWSWRKKWWKHTSCQPRR